MSFESLFPMRKPVVSILNKQSGTKAEYVLTACAKNHGLFQDLQFERVSMNAQNAAGSLRLLRKRHCIPQSCLCALG
jgi:hypothetical protein